MNYPIWEIPSIGTAFLVALISIPHVYVSHFAIGGGLFLVLTEIMGYREKSAAILDYTKKHAKFFLLLTMVFGGMTGVGIWFIIALANPAAVSSLIHTFVFGWAIEWVFFVGEIVALFIYYYTFGKMEKKRHIRVGWIYFIFAWLSMVVINGIVAYMLTPGKWLETKLFWDGFFNPTYWQSLAFRSLFALMIAGLFGLLTASFLKDQKIRLKLVRYSAKWLLFPVVLFLASALWYINSVPEFTRALILVKSPRTAMFIKGFICLVPALILGTLIMVVKLPASLKRSVAFVLVILGLLQMGCFELTRELARRPYIISNYLYSTSIYVDDVDVVNKNGLLAEAKWVRHKNLTEANMLEAGHDLFRISCLPCHTVNGFFNDLVPLTEKYTEFGLDTYLNGVGKVKSEYMPPFMGNAQERKALARYIVSEIHGKPVAVPLEVADLNPLDPVGIPAFSMDESEYILLAWNDLGMHSITDEDSMFNILPPANTLFAQLILRGEAPEIIRENVVLEYAVEDGFAHPEKNVSFWKYGKMLDGTDLEPGVGVAGNRVTGSMSLDESAGAYIAGMIPVVPYPDGGGFNPYPVITVRALDAVSGQVLAETKCVAPASTELGCRNCHGGEWRMEGRTGLSVETAADILKVHDRDQQTNLYAEASSGRPVLCRSCHGDPVMGQNGKPDVLNLSAAIHGFHANYLTERDSSVCGLCHPASASGSTRSFRGIHNALGLECTACHGTLEDHALSLLVNERYAGKSVADKLIRHLKPREVDSSDEIKPRMPWLQEPDCLNCHVDFEPPEVESTFNAWTKDGASLFRNRTGEMGVMCAACHGSPHAIYPADNPYEVNRDNIGPLQYQNEPYPIGANRNCKVCHTIDMEDDAHHPNMLADFRNTVD